MKSLVIHVNMNTVILVKAVMAVTMSIIGGNDLN